MSLWRLQADHSIWVVANKNHKDLKNWDIPYVVRENTGLEWGAYNHYLMNLWEGGRTVFMHDDMRFNPIIQNYEIVPGEAAFKVFDNITSDQAYIFTNRKDDVVNHGMHGRMVYMSDRFMGSIKEQGGFFYDKKNTGYITGRDKHKREELGCLGYNAGILKFHEQARNTGLDVHNKFYMPSIDMGIRGEFGGQR